MIDVETGGVVKGNKSGEPVMVLLSGGLDSAVSLVSLEADPQYQVIRAILIDYGQRTFKHERKAAMSLAHYYGIPLQVISLAWLTDLLPAGMHTDGDIQEATALRDVWVPNRNGLFLNLAASLAEAYSCRYVAFGANLDEAHAGFPDNAEPFWRSVNESLRHSTLNQVETLVPVGHLTKREIVQQGVKLGLPFKYIWSCYEPGEVHCGECASCQHLKKALSLENVPFLFSSALVDH
jgi:7-cyano-7-deazaguanine synthase